MEQKHNGNFGEIFQGGKQMYLFSEFVDIILQCDEKETKKTQEDF